jgi:hypothetical protein
MRAVGRAVDEAMLKTIAASMKERNDHAKATA